MNGIEQIIQQLMGGAGRPGEWLWAIDERSFQQHIASRVHGRLMQVTPASITKRLGATGIVAIHGVMMKDAYYSDETSTPAIQEAIRMAAADPDIASILLDFDSPGGSCAGLAELADTIASVKGTKPMVAQCSGLMASAAYYTAAQADKIYANRMDLVGSIGTRLMLYDFSKMFENLGITPIAFDTGPLKSTGAFGTAITDEQKTYLQGIVDAYQKDFAAIVQRGRGFGDAEFAAVATGGVFPAAEALRLKLIDGIQTVEKTLAAMPRQQTTSQRSTKMTEQNQDIAAPKAATIAELKKEMPEASADFLLAQLSVEATLSDAIKAYSTLLRAENAKLIQEKADSEKKLADSQKKVPAKEFVRGTKVGSSGSEETDESAEFSGDARSEWDQEIEKELAKPHVKTRAKAVSNVNKRRPELREALVAVANG